MKIFKTLVTIMVVMLMCSTAFAFKGVSITPSVKGSYFQATEKGIGEANKFLLGFDTTVSTTYKGLFLSVRPEIMRVMDSLNEDEAIPLFGMGVEGLVGYNVYKDENISVIPVGGLYYTYFTRDENIKYPNSWTHANDLLGKIGIQVKYGIFYANAGVLMPVWSGSNSHPENALTFRLSEDLEAGIVYKAVKLGIFRKTLTQENGWTDEALTGGLLGVTF